MSLARAVGEALLRLPELPDEFRPVADRAAAGLELKDWHLAQLVRALEHLEVNDAEFKRVSDIADTLADDKADLVELVEAIGQIAGIPWAKATDNNKIVDAVERAFEDRRRLEGEIEALVVDTLGLPPETDFEDVLIAVEALVRGKP